MKPCTCERHGHEKHQINPAIPPWKPWNHDSAADDTQLEAVKRAPVGSVLTYAAVKLSWLLHSLELVKAWACHNSGTGY